MGVYGAIGGAVLGGLGGIIKNKGERDRLTKIMEASKRYKDGVPRAYGREQDALIKALSAGKADQAMAEANVARTSLGRRLTEVAGSGDSLGTRSAMMSGEEANLAGGVGRAVGSESVGNLSGASTNVSQRANDDLNRRRIQLEALRMYNEAKNARRTGFDAFVGGAANGAMAGAALPV